jgi:hypothetical protein
MIKSESHQRFEDEVAADVEATAGDTAFFGEVFKGLASSTQSPNGQFVYLAGSGNTKVQDGVTVDGDGQYINRFKRTGDTYTYQGKVLINSCSNVRSMAVSNDGTLLAVAASHINPSTTNLGYINIYSINQTTGAISLVRSIRKQIANSFIQDPVYTLSWSDKDTYLALGGLSSTTSAPTEGNSPLIVWKKVGTTYVELVVDNQGYNWPAPTTVSNNIVYGLDFSSV